MATRTSDVPDLKLSTRSASGLVRQVSTFDTFLYSVLQIAVQFIFLITAAWVFYPGASMEMSTLIVIVGAGMLGIAYGLFAAIYPRSGGEYVFITRSLHPALGFSASFTMTFWMAWSIGTNAAIVSIFTLSPMVSALGVQTNSSAISSIGDFVGSKTGIFLIGLVVMVGVTWALVKGMRLYFRIQKLFFAIAAASLLLTLVILFLGAVGAISFRGQFDAVAGHGSFAKVVAAAQSSGANLHAGGSAWETLKFAIWPTESLLFGLLAASFAGEVKNPARNQLVGIVGGMVVAGIGMILLEFLARKAIGDDFLRAASYLSSNGSHAYTLPDAKLPFLISILSGSPVLTVLVNLWFVALSLLLPGACLIYSSRCMFAWGIDGTAPSSFAKVSRTNHTPTVAIGISFVIAAITLVLFAYTTVFSVLSALIGQCVVFGLVALGAIVLPRRRRRLYEGSTANLKFLGRPLMSVAGAVGIVFLGFLIYRAFVDDHAGVNSHTTLYLTLVVAVLGFVWFYAARALRAREGVDLDLRTTEIPVE
jgi:amino acid transporter